MGEAEAASEQTSKQPIAYGRQRGDRRRKRTPMPFACASMRRYGRGSHNTEPQTSSEAKGDGGRREGVAGVAQVGTVFSSALALHAHARCAGGRERDYSPRGSPDADERSSTLVGGAVAGSVGGRVGTTVIG